MKRYCLDTDSPAFQYPNQQERKRKKILGGERLLFLKKTKSAKKKRGGEVGGGRRKEKKEGVGGRKKRKKNVRWERVFRDSFLSTQTPRKEGRRKLFLLFWSAGNIIVSTSILDFEITS
ncbi:MAG: hypothetical protein IPP25_19210 [Saprospiraceae bacterium]|nr:hypothetical protein [Candidatus Opimibacter skivensis]